MKKRNKFFAMTFLSLVVFVLQGLFFSCAPILNNIAGLGDEDSGNNGVKTNDVPSDTTDSKSEYSIIYNLDGGKNSSANPTTICEDETVILTEPIKIGYTFGGWYQEKDFINQISQITNATDNIVLYAKWIPATDTAYKVEHCQQNISNDDYTTVYTETKTGTTDTQTSATAINYTGFTAKSITQETIAADGSTIVKIYYDRNTITFTFNPNGGNWNGNTANKTITGKYGADVTEPSIPSKTGYSFSGWDKTIPATFTENTTFTAVWTENEISISVTLPDIATDMTALTYTDNSGSLTFIAQNRYSKYEWYFDDTKVENVSANTYVLYKNRVNIGIHFVMVVVTDASGKLYSSQAQIVVTKQG